MSNDEGKIVVPKDIWKMFTDLCCMEQIAAVSMRWGNGCVEIGYYRDFEQAYKIGARSIAHGLLWTGMHKSESEGRELYNYVYRIGTVKKIGLHQVTTPASYKEMYEQVVSYGTQSGFPIYTKVTVRDIQ